MTVQIIVESLLCPRLSATCEEHTTSVRGAQYKYCIVKNSKIPKYSFHKLPFESFRIRPLALWPLPFNFEILVFLINIWPLLHLLHTVHVLFSFHDFFHHKQWLGLSFSAAPSPTYMIHQSSEWPDQNPQILQIVFRKCQLFKIKWQRPQGQRPDSKAFTW